MRVAVMDVNDSDRRQIAQMIRDCDTRSSPGPPDIEIIEFESHAKLGSVIGRMTFEGIFIAVENLEDFQTAWDLYDTDKDCRIVFVSSGDSFSIISYRLAAAHYLKKPIKPEEIKEALRRIAEAGSA